MVPSFSFPTEPQHNTVQKRCLQHTQKPNHQAQLYKCHDSSHTSNNKKVEHKLQRWSPCVEDQVPEQELTCESGGHNWPHEALLLTAEVLGCGTTWCSLFCVTTVSWQAVTGP